VIGPIDLLAAHPARWHRPFRVRMARAVGRVLLGAIGVIALMLLQHAGDAADGRGWADESASSTVAEVLAEPMAGLGFGDLLALVARAEEGRWRVDTLSTRAGAIDRGGPVAVALRAVVAEASPIVGRSGSQGSASDLVRAALTSEATPTVRIDAVTPTVGGTIVDVTLQIRRDDRRRVGPPPEAGSTDVAARVQDVVGRSRATMVALRLPGDERDDTVTLTVTGDLAALAALIDDLERDVSSPRRIGLLVLQSVGPPGAASVGAPVGPSGAASFETPAATTSFQLQVTFTPRAPARLPAQAPSAGPGGTTAPSLPARSTGG
jgi:hypothetical protein